MGAYDDIIHLPHPTSARHPRMPMIDRAAQFTPFQALTGYGEAIQETARITGEKMELTEEEKAVLDDKLRLMLDTGSEGTFTYFLPDGKKNGGAYITVLGTIRKADIQKLNVLSRMIDGMNCEEHHIFSGALDAESVNGLDDVLQIAGRIGQYEFIEGITSDKELGGWLVEHGLAGVDFPEAVRPYLDYAGIGAEYYASTAEPTRPAAM